MLDDEGVGKIQVVEDLARQAQALDAGNGLDKDGDAAVGWHHAVHSHQVGDQDEHGRGAGTVAEDGLRELDGGAGGGIRALQVENAVAVLDALDGGKGRGEPALTDVASSGNGDSLIDTWQLASHDHSLGALLLKLLDHVFGALISTGDDVTTANGFIKGLVLLHEAENFSRVSSRAGKYEKEIAMGVMPVVLASCRESSNEVGSILGDVAVEVLVWIIRILFSQWLMSEYLRNHEEASIRIGKGRRRVRR